MPKTPTPRVPTFPLKDCTEPSPAIVNASESTEVIPPAEIADTLGVIPPEDVEIEEVLSKQIRCTETGVIIDGELPFQKWVRGFEFFQTLRSKTQWWRGDMLIHGEKHYGESYAQAVDIHGKSESRLATYVYVCAKFPMERRRPELSFDHHAECASLEAREADALLLRAIRERWTKMDVREETARINERNGIPSNRRGRKPGSVSAKLAASGKQPQVPDAEKPLIWNGYPLRVMIMPDATRVILQGDEALPLEEADRAAHQYCHAHGPALAAWLEEHNFIKGGDEPCANSQNLKGQEIPTKSASNGAAPNATESAPTPYMPLVAPFPAPAAPPASPEPTLSADSAKAIVTDAIAIFTRFSEGETPAFLAGEYKTNVDGVIKAIRSAAKTILRTNDAFADGARIAAPATQMTPLQRAEEALLAFAAASQEVNWEEIGENKLLRAKWLERLLLPADEVIDRIQNIPLKARK